MNDMNFVDLLAFFCRMVPAFLIALVLWSVAIGVVAAILLAMWAAAG